MLTKRIKKLPIITVRKKKFPWTGKQKFCDVCKSFLNYESKQCEGLYWCDKCCDWKYPNWYGRPVRLLQRRPELERSLRMTSKQMRDKMQEYQDKFNISELANVKVYKSEDFDQTFLKSLIPKGK